MNKYVCPKCGGKLYYWMEQVNELRRNINPSTGRLNKTVQRMIPGEFYDNEGLACHDCDWSYNTISLAGSDNVDIPDILTRVDGASWKRGM